MTEDINRKNGEKEEFINFLCVLFSERKQRKIVFLLKVRSSVSFEDAHRLLLLGHYQTCVTF